MKDVDLDQLKVTRTPAAPRRRRGGGRWLLWLVLLGAAAAAAFYFYGHRAPLVTTTRVVSVWPAQAYGVLDATGYVIAQKQAAVAPRGTGRVAWLGVAEGDSVRGGTVVARLESADVEATLRSAAAQVEVARANLASAQTEQMDADQAFQRATRLVAQGLAARVTVTDAESRLRRAQAAVRSAQASLSSAQAQQDNARSLRDDTQLRAPFDGVVIARSANVGDIVTPLSSAADAKGAVMLIADLSTLAVEAEVSESSLAQIKTGQPVEVALDAFPDRRFAGELAAIIPTVNRASATVTTQIRFLAPVTQALPDMSARVTFLSQPIPPEAQKSVLAVDPLAVQRRGTVTQVFRVTAQGLVEAIPVQTRDPIGDLLPIEGVVNAGDTLVLSPPPDLQSGDAIQRADAP